MRQESGWCSVCGVYPNKGRIVSQIYSIMSDVDSNDGGRDGSLQAARPDRDRSGSLSSRATSLSPLPLPRLVFVLRLLRILVVWEKPRYRGHRLPTIRSLQPVPKAKMHRALS